MKTLFILLLLTSSALHSQEYPITNSSMNTVYLGYDNVLTIGSNNGKRNFRISTINCSLTPLDSAYSYNLRPDYTAEKKCSLIFVDTLTNQEINRVVFNVYSLPDPELYWGGARNGEKAFRAETMVFCKYPPEIPIYARFWVLDIELLHPDGTSVKVEGAAFNDEAKSLVRDLKTGESLTILAYVVGPDGVRRKKAGKWTL